MKSHLVIDGNAFYEVDDECIRRKKEAGKREESYTNAELSDKIKALKQRKERIKNEENDSGPAESLRS